MYYNYLNPPSTHHGIGQRPNIVQLRSFKLNDNRVIDIVTEVGSNYKKFGELLLESETEVNIIEMSSHYDPKTIVDKILCEWIAGKGRHPLTWQTLVDTIEESDLRTLASDLRGHLS